MISLKRLSIENHRIRKIISSFNTECGSFQHNLLVASHYSASSSEQTIVKHSSSDSISTIKSLVKKMTEKISKNPTNGYISKETDGFYGYLACGSTTHQFVTS